MTRNTRENTSATSNGFVFTTLTSCIFSHGVAWFIFENHPNVHRKVLDHAESCGTSLATTSIPFFSRFYRIKMHSYNVTMQKYERIGYQAIHHWLLWFVAWPRHKGYRHGAAPSTLPTRRWWENLQDTGAHELYQRWGRLPVDFPLNQSIDLINLINRKSCDLDAIYPMIFLECEMISDMFCNEKIALHP